MISASSRARVLNGETTIWATRLKNSIIRTSLAPLAAHASADEVFGKDRRSGTPKAKRTLNEDENAFRQPRQRAGSPAILAGGFNIPFAPSFSPLLLTTIPFGDRHIVTTDVMCTDIVCSPVTSLSL